MTTKGAGKAPPRRNRAPKPETIAKEQRILELRMAGATFAQCAEAVGYTDPSTARDAYLRSMRRILSPAAEELRELQTARYERLIRANWPQAIGAGGRDPSTRHTDAVLRAMKALNELHGLNAPIKVTQDINITEGSDIDKAVQALAEALATNDTPTT